MHGGNNCESKKSDQLRSNITGWNQPIKRNTSDMTCRCDSCNNMQSNFIFSFKTCSKCKAVFFLLKEGQVNSLNHHKSLCQTIKYLELQHIANISKETAFNTQLAKEMTKLVNALGEKCNLYCLFICNLY